MSPAPMDRKEVAHAGGLFFMSTFMKELAFTPLDER
jgi:hypothetical protein